MFALVVGIFIWTLGFFLESHSSSLGTQLIFNNIGYLGSMSVPIAWFVFSAVKCTPRELAQASTICARALRYNPVLVEQLRQERYG